MFTTISALVAGQTITSGMAAGTVVSNVAKVDGLYVLTIQDADGVWARVLNGADPIEADAAPAPVEPAPGVRTLPRVQDYLLQRAVTAHEAYGQALASLARGVNDDLRDFRAGTRPFGVSSQRLIEVPAYGAAARAAIDAAVASGVAEVVLLAALADAAAQVL